MVVCRNDEFLIELVHGHLLLYNLYQQKYQNHSNHCQFNTVSENFGILEIADTVQLCVEIMGITDTELRWQKRMSRAFKTD